MVEMLHDARSGLRDPLVEITVPVFNEEAILEASISELHAYLTASLPFAWRIVIADNASTDSTAAIASDLAARYGEVRVLRLEEKGRGRALRAAWLGSDADIVGYVDADLSTGLTGLLPLVAPLISGHSDLAIGSRLSAGSIVARGPKREVISRFYNLILRLVFAVRFRDAQCGFKAVRATIAKRLVPAVVDEEWFFDTEMLLLAEHNGLRVHEVPVDWVDDPKSSVSIASTAMGDLRGVARMVATFLRGGGEIDFGSDQRRQASDDLGRQTVTFLLIGLVSTVAALGLFLALVSVLGPIGANAVGFTMVTLGNSWAHRRFTFQRREAAGRWRHVIGVTLLYLFSLGLATAGLVLVGDDLASQVAVLLLAWAIAAGVRFALMRSWVYPR